MLVHCRARIVVRRLVRVGKKAARNRQQQGKPAVRNVLGEAELEATRELMAALRRWEAVMTRCRSEYVSMPDGFASLYEFVNEGGASLEVGEWDEAWTMIQEGRPVAALLPRWDMNNQLAGGGRRWHGPQRPYQVLELFDVAEELGEGRSFLEQFAVNAEEQRVADEALEADLGQVCGMPTSNGPCQTLPIYRPGGRAGGPCWRHLTPGQRELLEAVWDGAVAEYDCPGCVARAGRKCYAGNAAQGDKLRVVDGRWPRTRQFSGRSIHQERLDLMPRPDLDVDG